MAGICNGGGGASSVILEAIKNWNKKKLFIFKLI